MTDHQFNVAFGEAANYSDRDAFVSDLALSSIFEDEPEDDIPEERLEELGRIWDAAQLTTKDIRTAAGLTQKAFAERFCIPVRTVIGWENGSGCPAYVKLLLAKACGMI